MPGIGSTVDPVSTPSTSFGRYRVQEATRSSTARLLTVTQACDYLSLSRTTLYQLIAGGELATLKIRGARRVDVAELDRYIDRVAVAS
jgi:excisionase family DNA binding protein